MFSRTRVLGPRLTMFCLALLLANCGEESADALHCIDNYVINAKLGETPIVPNLCSGATTALEQLWDPKKYQVDVVTNASNAALVGSVVSGQTQFVVKQTMEKAETETFTILVTKLGKVCKDALKKDVPCSAEVTFSVAFSVDGGLSVTIAGTPPSGIVLPSQPTVKLTAMPAGAMAPAYRWERTKLVQSTPATFEMVGTDPAIDAQGFGTDSYLYRVVVSDGSRNATAATVLRPQAFGAQIDLVNFSTYPGGEDFSFLVRSEKAVTYVFRAEEATECGGMAISPDDLPVLASSPDLLVGCTWRASQPSEAKHAIASEDQLLKSSTFRSPNFNLEHEGLYRVIVTATPDSGDGNVVLDRAFFRKY